MANDDVKSKITGWCTSAELLTVAGEPQTPNTDLALDLRYGDADGLPIAVSLPSSAAKLHLTHDVELPSGAFSWQSSGQNGGHGTFHDKLAHLVDHMPGTVRAAVATESGQQVVRVTTWIYLDGLTQQSFMAAVNDLQRSHDAVLHMAEKLGAAPKEASQPAAQPAPQPEPVAAAVAAAPAATPASDSTPATPVGLPAATPWAPSNLPASSPMPGTTLPAPVQPFTAATHPVPSPQPFAPQAAPQPAVGGFAPSHHVPPMGMQAWAAPDPRGQVVAHLAAHLPVMVKETRGAWANIVCSNGWTGWVDARLLVSGAA